MLDLIPVPPSLRDAITPLTNLLHLHTLPLHIHEVILSYLGYTFLNSFLASRLSAYLLPTAYGKFSPRTKLQWNIHVTSLVNSILVSGSALYVLYADLDRLNETWEQRMWGYTGLGGMVQALGAGYFLWDVQICAVNMKALGVTDLLHAVVALSIAVLGFVGRNFARRSSPADFTPASLWLILRDSVRLGGALYPVRQHSLVSQQIGQSWLDPSDRQRHGAHRNVCMLPAVMGFVSHRCVFP